MEPIERYNVEKSSCPHWAKVENSALELPLKEILPHLGDLTPINHTMTEEEKLAIIQREFDRLYDPCHLVRNNLETLDSVEVVRSIREVLNR